MRKVVVIAGLAAFAVAGCGSTGEATTITQTVTAKESSAKSPAPSGGKPEAPEGATSGTIPTGTTIPDGTWKRGEYTPGEYRAPGGATCSWEQDQKLGGEAAGESFNENYGVGETNPFIKIDSPYFKTENCGVWQKVGG